jgi:cyclase
MKKVEISSNITAFVHRQGRSSCGMIQTSEGIVLIDTTGRPVDMQACLDMATKNTDDICQILITHSHSDHTSGIPLFDCPVLAHKLTKRRIKNRRTERSKHQIPTHTFKNYSLLEIGGVVFEVIHAGGHTPGSSVVWLPDEQILFTGDLIFEGRYPFLATANIQKLMAALRWLTGFGARMIVPGHGELCNKDEVRWQLDYLETTWERTAEHIARGHSLEETINDTEYPIYAEFGYEKLHPWNIKVTYQQLRKQIGQ